MQMRTRASGTCSLSWHAGRHEIFALVVAIPAASVASYQSIEVHQIGETLKFSIFPARATHVTRVGSHEVFAHFWLGNCSPTDNHCTIDDPRFRKNCLIFLDPLASPHRIAVSSRDGDRPVCLPDEITR